MSHEKVIKNSGILKILDTSNGKEGVINGYITVVYNLDMGHCTVNGGTFLTRSTSYGGTAGYAICNNGNGTVEVIDGSIINYDIDYYSPKGIYNNSDGEIIIIGGNIYGEVYNNAKGSIIIGTNDDTLTNDEPYVKSVRLEYPGAKIEFYDGKVGFKNISKFIYEDTSKFDCLAVEISKNTILVSENGLYYLVPNYTKDEANYWMEYTNESGEKIEQGYKSLGLAFSSAPDSIKTTITVLKNTVEYKKATVLSKKNIVVDMDGKTVEFIFENAVSSAIPVSGTLQVLDNSELGGSVLKVTVDNAGRTTSLFSASSSTIILGENDGIVKYYPRFYAYNHVTDCWGADVYFYDGIATAYYPLYGGVDKIPAGYKVVGFSNSNSLESDFLVKKDEITFIPETTCWTNEDISIKISFATGGKNRYKVGDGEWQATTSSYVTIKVSENMTIYAKTLNSDEVEISSGEYIVTNIDKEVPIIGKTNITNPNAQKQTITVSNITDNENGSGIKGHIVTMNSQKPAKDAEWIEDATLSFSYDVAKNGKWYVYVIDNAGNVSDGAMVVAENIDSDKPYVTNIEVISPADGIYTANTQVKIKVNWSENINVTSAPNLKIKFGDGEVKVATANEITENSISYIYSIQVEDDGKMTFVEYIGGEVTDSIGNPYELNDIEFFEKEIVAKTCVYIEESNTYYSTIKDAIDSCKIGAEDETHIRLVNNNYYEGTVQILEGQKIILDLNGKLLQLKNKATAIKNAGNLVIEDFSNEKSGQIELYTETLQGTSRVIYNTETGYLKINSGKITSEKVITGWVGLNKYGILNYGTLIMNDGLVESYMGMASYSGNVTINSGTIDSYSTCVTLGSNTNMTINGGYITGGAYAITGNATLVINGGEFRGSVAGIQQIDNINNDGTVKENMVNLPLNYYLASRIEDRYVVNYLEKGAGVVELEMNDTVTTYLSLNNALAAIPTDGTLGKIKLLTDIHFKDTINISKGKNVLLDLNGKYVGNTLKNINYGISIYGKLTILDSSLETSGELNIVTNSHNSSYENTAVYNSGDFIMNSGTISLGSDLDLCNIGKVIINGGKIKGEYNTTIYNQNSGKIIINGGEITSYSKYQSCNYAIRNNETGVIEINGGSISAENSSTSHSTYESYSICMDDKNGILNLYGGYLKSRVYGIKAPSDMGINCDGTSKKGFINLPPNKHIACIYEDEYVINFLEDNGEIASLELNGITTTYPSIKSAIMQIPTDGTLGKIQMLKDEVLSMEICILENQNIEIDLNGKMLSLYNRNVLINNLGNLHIKDTSNDKSGRLYLKNQIGSYSSSYMTYGIYNKGNGQVNFEDIILELEGINYSSSYTYGIANESKKEFIMNSGSIVLHSPKKSEVYNSLYGIANKGIGNVVFNDGNIDINSRGSAFGIVNESTGNIEMNNGTINSIGDSSIIGIHNLNEGNIIVNGGLINCSKNVSNYSYSMYAIENKNTGYIEINGGLLVTEDYVNSTGSGTVYFNNTNAKFKFTGGKICGRNRAYCPENKKIEIPENKHIKKYEEMYDSYRYYIAEIEEMYSVKLTNKGYTSYYSTIYDAIAAVPSDGTFSLIEMLDDEVISRENIIASGKNIQLDLAGKTISYYSNSDYIRAFINNGKFEITDSVGNGKIHVETDGYQAYGIANAYYSRSNSNAKFKLIKGNIEVISNGKKAYGIYNGYGETDDAIVIEGGSISVKSIAEDNEVSSQNAYGIYNNTVGDVKIAGDDINIIATSAHQKSYGYYNNSKNANKITIGNKEKALNDSSPFIKAGTSGIYVGEKGNMYFYDGVITGTSNYSIDGTIAEIKPNTELYVIDNQDGTETTILYKRILELSVNPSKILLGNANKHSVLEISKRPFDATGVKIKYIVDNSDIGTVIYKDGQYLAKPVSNGETTVTFIATDVAGNIVSGEAMLIVDITPPSNDAPSITSTGNSVTIICNQTDNDLDTNSIRYAISSDNGKTWSNWKLRNTITGLNSNTLYLVKTKASDFAGNVTESETAIIRTKLANNPLFITEPTEMTKDNVIVTITWNNPEGTPQYYKVENGDWILTTEETTTLTITENNTTVYTKLVYDGIEDSEIKSLLVDNIDRLIPTGSIFVNEDEPDYDGNITLTIATYDDASTVGDGNGAVAYMYLTEENLSSAPSEDAEGWIRYEGDYDAYPYMIAEEGTTIIYAWFMDKAKNVSEVAQTESITYAPPTVVLYEDDVVIGEYETISEAYSAARTGNVNPSIIKLYKNTTIETMLTIDSSKNIVIDLNGKLVTSALVKTITNNGTLEFRDSKENGTLRNTYSVNYATPYTVYNNKNLTISGGNIEITNTSSYGYNTYVIYNNGSSATMEMTGGRIYGYETSSYNYSVFGIYNTSSYTTKESVVISGGTIDVEAQKSTAAYGIYNSSSGKVIISDSEIIANAVSNSAIGIYKNGSGRIDVLSGNISANSTSGTGYGIYNNNSSNAITIGSDDGIVYDDEVIVSGSKYGIYRYNGTFNFYDGSISGKEGNSIYCLPNYLNVPKYYGTTTSVKNGIETSTLVYDTTKPTIESLTITNDVDVNEQTIIAKNVRDEGTGVIAYYVSTSATVPTRTSVTWNTIERTNGPVDVSAKATSNGTWYFWVMDAAGNVSDTMSIVAENVRVKVTNMSISNITLQPGEQVVITPTLTPNNGEAKSISFTSSDESIAYVHPETGNVTGIALGKATISCVLVNYDGSILQSSCTATIQVNPPKIITNPLDRVVTEGTTTDFFVDATGMDLNYQWYEVSNGVEKELDDTNSKLYKSNIEGQANTTATETIVIKSTVNGTLSFDYMVSSEENNDTFTVTVDDANGKTTAVNAISGNVAWTNYSKEFTPNANGEIVLTLTYSKNGSVDAGLDFGAIRNLSYYYYGIINAETTYSDDEYFTYVTPNASIYTNYSSSSHYPWEKSTENGETVYKSTIENLGSKVSTATIIINTSVEGKLSFDYAVSSESPSYDWLTITVVDGNGTHDVAKQKGGTSDTAYKNYSASITPDANNQVKINLTYRKDGSVNSGLDRGAIKNLKVNAEGYRTDYSTFESDDIFKVSGSNWKSTSYIGMNTATLTIPGAFVTDAISGNKYYCKVTNIGGEAISSSATLTVADTAGEVETSISKTAPTLEVGYREITATCNQVGENILNTWYAISIDNVTYGAWQSSNVFTNLTEGITYYVKTKVATSTKEEESLESYALVPRYVASLTESGTTTYYTKLQSAINTASTTSTNTQSIIKLLNDETTVNYISVIKGKNIKLDLNGYELLVANSSSSTLYGIYNQGTLEIIDTIGTGEIHVSSSYATSNNVYGLYNYSGAKLNFTSGKVSVYKADAYKSATYGVYNSGGTLTIGESGGALSITNPSIDSVNYGIYTSNGTTNFYDGVITADKSKSVYGNMNVEKDCRLNTIEQINNEVSYLIEVVVNESKAVITTWNIPSSNVTIKLPISKSDEMNIVVDWGDGSEVEWIDRKSFPTHTYANAGTYDIKVSGKALDFGNYMNNVINGSSDYYSFTTYVVGLKQWGEIGAERYGFASCKNLVGDLPNPSENTFESVTDMSYMFYNCTSLERANLAAFDTANVNDMDGMFENCISLRSVFVGENVDKFSGIDMFTGDISLKAIIMQKPITLSIYAMKMREDTGLNNLPNAILYVPNALSEIMYQKADNYSKAFGDERILPILGLAGKNPYNVAQNTVYDMTKDIGATVAGFDKSNAEDYAVYGYFIESPDLPLDTSELGIKTITYNLKHKSVTNVTTDVMSITRTINIIEGPMLMEREATETAYVIGAYRENNNTSYTADKIRTITLMGDVNFAEIGDVVDMWDVSYLYGDKEIFAYLKNNSEISTMYDLYIVSETRIKAPANSKDLFSKYTNCVSITGLDNLITHGIENMNNMFARCYKLTELDLFNFNTLKVRNMDEMFIHDSSIKVLNLGDTFDKFSGENMFAGMMNLEKIITTRGLSTSSEVINLSENTALDSISATLYVPTVEAEASYEAAENYSSIGTDRIRPILEINGEEIVKIALDSIYNENTDKGATIAGYTTDNAYSKYGYSMEVTGLPVDTSEITDREVTYTAKLNGNTLMTATRIVRVVDANKLMERETYAYIDGKMVCYAIGASRANKISYTADKIKTITLVDSPVVSVDALDYWDASFTNGDEQIMAWVKTNTKDTSMYDLYIGGDKAIIAPINSQRLFADYTNCTTISGLELLNTNRVTNMSKLFQNDINLVYLDTDIVNWDISKVLDMSYAFNNCENIVNLDLSNWKTSSLTNAQSMFENCYTLTNLKLNNFNTENVTSFENMFSECQNLNELKFSNWKTDNATKMSKMFYNCGVLTTLDLSGWNVSNVENMDSMFENCKNLGTLNLNNWKVSALISAKNMFKNCKSVSTLAVTNWDTSLLENATSMFEGCNNLRTMDVSSWSTENIQFADYMFKDCSLIEILNLTSWNTSSIKTMKSMFENCSKLKVIQLGKDFTMLDEKQFASCGNLKAIITERQITSSADAIKLPVNTGLKELPNAILYVLDTVSETNYENAVNYADELGTERIKPILALQGEEYVAIRPGEAYADAGATVAGLTVVNSKIYTDLGYTLSSTSSVKENESGRYEVVWTVYKPTNNALMSVRREVYVRYIPTVPVITVTQNGNQITSGNWATGDVVITIGGSTYAEGLVEYIYSLDDSSWSVGNTFEYNMETLSTIIHAKARGIADNEDISEETTFELKLDKTTPEIVTHERIRYDGVNEVIALTTYDGGISSGIEAYGISATNDVKTATWQTHNELVISENGTWYTWVRDNAGNVSNVYTLTTNEKITVEVTYEAKVEYYSDVYKAIEALNNKGIGEATIKLLEDNTISSDFENSVIREIVIYAGSNYTLDLNGEKLVCSDGIVVRGKLTVVNSDEAMSYIKHESGLTTTSTISVEGELIVDGNVQIESEASIGYAIDVLSKGTATLYECKVISNNSNSTIHNAGTLTLGKEDENVSIDIPYIEGSDVAIDNDATLNIYDGKLVSTNKGTILDGTVTALQTGYHLVKTETTSTKEMYLETNDTWIEYWDISETAGTDNVYAGIKIVEGDGITDNTRYKLVVGGTGNAKSFSIEYTDSEIVTEIPWFNKYANTIVELDLEEGVTKYGSYTFYRLVNVKSLTLPESLREIEVYAFAKMCALTGNVNIPKNVYVVRNGNPFYDTNVTSFTVDAENTKFKAIDDTLYNITNNSLVAYPTGRTNATMIVVDGTTSIGERAFAKNKYLKTTKLPNTLTEIDWGAFENTVIEEITIPSSVTSIYGHAFNGCSNLKNVYLKINTLNSSTTGNRFINLAKNSIIYTESKEIANMLEPDVEYTSANTKVYYPFEILTTLTDAEIARGETLHFEMEVQEGNTADDVIYQWYKDGEPITGANSLTYTKTSFTDDDRGVYKFVVRSAFQNNGEYYYTVESNEVTISLGDFEPPEEVNSSIKYNDDGSATVTIVGKDKETGVDKIIVDGNEIEIEKNSEKGTATGKFDISKSGDYTVEVKDYEENTTTITITAYEIHYKPNALSYEGTTNYQIKIKDTDIRLRTNGFERAGHEFTSWNTKEEGTGETYNANALYTGNENMVLYATWNVLEYVVRFYNDNGIDGEQLVSEATYQYGATIEVPKEQYKTATEIDGEKYRIYYHNDNWTAVRTNTNSKEKPVNITSSNKDSIKMVDSNVNYYATYSYRDYPITQGTIKIDGNSQITGEEVGIINNEGLVIIGENSTEASKPTITGTTPIQNNNGILLWYVGDVR